MTPRENSPSGAPDPSHAAWERRILRARHLSRTLPAASDALDFYAVLASTQESLLETHAEAVRPGETFAASLDVGIVAEAMPKLLSTVSRIAPEPLAETAAAMARSAPDHWRALVLRHWAERDEPDPARAFLAEALLQPFAELIALRLGGSGRGAPQSDTPAVCPVCSGLPVVGVLREEAHGAKRSLVCGFCLGEWAFPRIGCSSCGEEQFEKLPAYRAETLPAARIDACETCRAYLKTIDLTKDGHAVPVVDDLATLPLDLWAREQGYQRIRPNLLRL